MGKKSKVLLLLFTSGKSWLGQLEDHDPDDAFAGQS